MNPGIAQKLPGVRAWVEIDLGAVHANVRSLLRFLAPGRALMAVVKANAYGHGLVPVAESALEAGASWIGVASVSEGAALREAGITAPIALLCVPAPSEVSVIVSHALTPQIGDPAFVTALALAAKGAGSPEVHLDIDTGMGRSGVLPESSVELWRQAIRCGLKVCGLSTHFADADGSETALTDEQWQRFENARRMLDAAGARFDWVHVGNSAATLRFSAHGCNLVRPGLLLYGICPNIPQSEDGRMEHDTLPHRHPFPEAIENPKSKIQNPSTQRAPEIQNPKSKIQNLLASLRPALSLKAQVGAVRELPAGHTISYGATCRLQRRSRVATVLIGYGDGYPRRLSNGGDMLLHGRRAPILGRVCMDQTVLDVTEVDNVTAGDIAVCIGTQGNEAITVEEIAQRIDTTEHEITTCLTARLPRVYHGSESGCLSPGSMV